MHSPKTKSKARMPVLSTAIQYNIGSSDQGNKTHKGTEGT